MKSFNKTTLAYSIAQAQRGPIPASGLALLSALAASPALAQTHNIDADSNHTTISTSGTHHTITAVNQAAKTVNVFNDFVVGTGHSVDLEVPKVNGQDATLINIVRDSRPEVHGTLNSILQNGDVGGNVIFASSHGFLVGSAGVINVGSLAIRTPTSNEMDKLISGGAAVSSELDRLANGEMSIDNDAEVEINGKIVTGSGLTVDAGKILVGSTGILMAGDNYQATYQVAVNAGDYTAPTELKVEGGTIVLTAHKGGSDSSAGIDIAGDLLADGGITIGLSVSEQSDLSLDVSKSAYVSIADTALLDTRDTDDAGALTNAGDITINVSAAADVNFAQANAHSEVNIDGEIHTGKLTVATESDADAEARDLGSVALKFGIANSTGIGFSYLESDADAIIRVGSNADINAGGDVSFNADSDSVARTNDVVLSSKGWSVATNYSRADAKAKVTVESGASIQTEGSLSLRADNEAYVEQAARNYVLSDSTDYALAIAVSNANVDAHAQIDSGVTLDAANVDVIATNQNFFVTKASISDYADKGTRGGFAVAIGDFDTNARAIMGASVGTSSDKVGEVRVISVNRTHRQQVASSVSVGASGAGQLVAQFAGTAASGAGNSIQSWISQKGNENANQDTKDNSKTDDTDENKVKWKAGSALSINLGDHDSYAYVGNTEDGGAAPTIVSDSDVYVLAANDTYSWRTSAESSISAPKCEDGSSGGSGNNTSCSEKSYSFAINVGVQNIDTRAAIGENSTLDVANLAVHASQRLPITQSYTEWQNLDSITSQMLAIAGSVDGKGGMAENLLTNFANSSASAEEKAIGGTVNSTVGLVQTSAWIGDGVSVTASGTGASGTSVLLDVNAKLEGTISNDTTNPVIAQQYNWNSSVDDSRRPDFYETDGSKSDTTNSPFLNTENRHLAADSVTVEAINIVENLSLLGNMGTLLIGPSGGTNTEGKTLGGAVSVQYMEVDTLAGVGDAKITATNSGGSLGIYSDFQERHIVITPTSGSGKGFGFNGILNVLITDAVNHASLSNEAEIVVDELEIAARHTVNNWTAAGALAMSSPSAIGMALTGNFSTTDNRAYIGDNSSDSNEHDFPSGSYPVPTPAPVTPATATTAGINSREVRVKSATNGLVGSVAAAGAYTSGAPRGESSGSYVSQAKNYLKDTSMVKALAKFMPALATGTGTSASGAASGGSTGNSGSSGTSVASGDTDSSGNPQNTDSNSTENQNKVNTGWTGAGSFTLALTDIDSRAYIDGATITNTSNSAADIDVLGLSKITGVSASGAAGLTWASGKDAAPDNTNNMAGAIAYQFSANDTRGNILDSVITGGDDVSVQAVHGGDRISIGLGLSVTIDAQKNEGETRNAGISFSGAAVEDTVQATVEGSTIESVGWNDNLEVLAYNNTNVGVGGGAFYYGGTQGLGLAITVATIGNNTDSIGGQLNDSDEEEVYAGVINSTLTNFGDVDVSSRNLSRIAIAAAGGGWGTDAGDSTNDTKGFAGSFAIADIGVRSHAIFDNSFITSTDSSKQTSSFELNSIGSKNGALDSLLSNMGDSGVSADYDFSGEKDVLSSNSVHSDDTGNGSAINANSEGARIIAVAGLLQGGTKQNVGISYVHSDIHNSHKALVTGGSGIIAGNVELAARDEALIYNVSVGIGVSKGDLAGVGSISVAEVNNRTEARIGSWEGSSRSGVITADTLAVHANNEADIFNLAGAVAWAQGDDISSKAGGMAGTVTLIGNQQGHETTARVGNTDLNVDGDITVKALSGTKDDDNLLITNSIGVGVTTSGEGIAFAGAITTSNVDQSVDAGIKNVGTSGSMDFTSDTANDLNIISRDDTFAVGTAWTLAYSSQGNALGVSVTTNRVDSDVTAELLGDNSNADSSYLKVSNANIEATRDNRLLSIDAGVAVGDDFSGAGSVGTNVVDGNVVARIADDARIDAYNNVGVIARAQTLSEAGSGAVGVGLNGSAGAVALATTVEYGNTRAYVDDAVINAAGNNGYLVALTGALNADPSKPTFGEDGDNDNEKKASDVDVDATLNGFAIATFDEQTENVTGLLVQASSTVKQRAVDLAGSYGSNYAAAINVATNATWGSTESYIQNASINQAITPAAGADVQVTSAAHAMGLAIAAGGAYGGTGGGVGGFATNHFSKSSHADILNTTLAANSVDVTGRQTNLSQAVSAGIGGGGSYGGAASVVITVMKGDTRASVRGGTVTADALAVNADSVEDSAMAAGALGVGGTGGVGATLALNFLENETEAWIGQAPSSRNRTSDTTINVDSVTLAANRQMRVENWAFGAGFAGTAGVALMLGITETGGHTRAGIYGMEDDSVADTYTTELRGKDGSSAATTIDVDAQESTSAFTGALGVGGGGTAGIGAAANVLLLRSQVVAESVGSDLMADDVQVHANSVRQSDLYNLSFGGGTGAVAASIGVVMTGKGDGGDAQQEFSANYESMAEGATQGDSTYDNVLTDEEKTEILSKRAADYILTDIPTDAPTDPDNHSNYSKDGSNLLLSDNHSATLAQISGGVVTTDSLSLLANAQHHAFSVIGAAQGSAVGVAGGFGITRINEQVQAVVDTDLNATNVDVIARMDNVSDEDASAEMLTIVAGAGGTAIGVAVADVRSSNRVLAAVSQGVGDGTGDLSVYAIDNTDLRVGDIDATFDSDGANDRINDIGTVNAQFGVAAVGVSYNHAEKNSDVDAWLGADGGTLAGYNNYYVDALSLGHAKAVGYGAAGGLFAGAQAVVAKAEDHSKVKAQLAGEIWTAGAWDGSVDTGVVQVNAVATPETIARAYGITVSGLGAVGGSFAYATADTTAVVSVDDDTSFYFAANGGSGPDDLHARPVYLNAVNGSLTDADYESALALSFAASGGLLVGLTGSHAEAENTGTTRVVLGDDINLPYSDLEVNALGVYRQRAESDGYFAGAVAGGASIAGSYSSTTTEIIVGADPLGATRAGDISFAALGDTSNMAFSIAGGGGVVSGSAAEAHAGARDKSGGSGDDQYKDSSVTVSIDDWSANAASVDAESLYIQAQSNHSFFAGTDSTTASVVGGSGASASGQFSDKASVDVGDNVAFHADRIAIQAAANLQQYDPNTAGSVPHFNSRYNASVQAGSGGVLNGSASHSFIKAEDLDASVTIGDDAVLWVNVDDNTLLSDAYGNNLLINAFSQFDIDDQATLVVGGAFQGAGAESKATVNTDNSIVVGNGAQLINDIDKIGLGAFARGYMITDASVSLYAAAGLAGAVSHATINSNNTVTVEDGALLLSNGLLNIMAGRSGDYLTENTLATDARANIYLGAIIPIEGSKQARSTITANNTINLGAADIQSVRDIFIEADDGSINASHRGVVKNLYDSIGLSSEESFGNSDELGSALLNFTGDTQVEAGIYHEQIVEITSNGNVYVNGELTAITFDGEEGQVPDSFSGKIFKPSAQYSARDEMQSYLDSLNADRTDLIAALMNGTSADEVTDGGGSEGDGSGSSTTSGSTGLTYEEAIATAEVLSIDGEIAFVASVLDSLPATSNNQIIVSDIIAAGGNVTLRGDSYSASSSPSITANGDPLIKITNASNNTLVVGNLLVPYTSGGNLVLEGGLSVSDLGTNYGTTTGSGQGGLIDIDHEPASGDGYGDVAIQGILSNLNGTVDINAVTGSVIQTAPIEARELNITVNTGTYLLNNPYGYQAFGFDPKSLVNFTTRYKPQNADDFVDYYVSSAEKSTWDNGNWDSAIDDGNDNHASFNEWFYGDLYDDDIDQNFSYNQSGTRYGGNGTYAGRLNINVYKNWGFRNVEGGTDWYECSSNCVTFAMGDKKHGDSRGGGDGWNFTPIDDMRSSLTSTATYNQVSNAGYGDRGGNAISAQTVAINARYVDINGTIRAGNYNNWSVQVGSGFDAAIAQYVADHGLSDGDQVVLTPGSTLRYQVENPNYNPALPSWMPGNNRYITTTLNPDISLVSRSNDDAGISLVYDVTSGRLQLNDVEASGNGTVTIRGTIMSTGPDGRIQVDNGLGDIKVVNQSNTVLDVGNIDAGSTSAGVIRITDLHSSKKVNGQTVSRWYVHTPGGNIETYITSQSASNYSGSVISSGSVSGNSTTYDPAKGQVYWFKEEKQISRTVDYQDGWVAKYGGVGSGDTYGWVFENQNTTWDLVGSGYTTCASAGLSCDGNGSASDYLTHVISADTAERRRNGYGWYATYKDYYGGQFTNNDYVIWVARQLGLDAKTYIKADHSIGIEFVGASAGKVDISSNAGMILTGNIANADGTTWLTSSSGWIFSDLDATTNADRLVLSAAGNIGVDGLAMVLQTNRIDAQSQTGLVNLDLAASGNSNILVDRLWADDDLSVVSQAGLLNNNTQSIALKGDDIDITLTQGGFGSVSINNTTGVVSLSNVMTLDSQGAVTISGGADSDGELQAVQGNVALREVSGNLEVNQILANGDVYIDVAAGELVNVNSRNQASAEEQAYEESIWSVLGLNDDSFAVGQAQVNAYNQAVTTDYHQYYRLGDQLARVASVADGSVDAALAAAQASNDAYAEQQNQMVLDRVANDFAEHLRQQTEEGLYAGYALGTEAAPDYVEYQRLLNDLQTAVSARIEGTDGSGAPQGTGVDLAQSYDAGFQFDLQTADAGAYTALLEGARWDDNQLEVSINKKAFDNTDSGSISNADRVSTIAGVDVWISTSGNLGTDDQRLDFTITQANPNLDGAQKAALLNASAGDVRATLNEDGGGNFVSLDLSIDQVNTIKIDATGYQRLYGGGVVYVESELDQQLHQVIGQGDVRLETEGSITQSGRWATAIQSGADLNLAANNGIGAAGEYLHIDVAGVLKDASSSGDVYLHHTGDLTLGNLSAGDTVRLDVDGALTNWDQGLPAATDAALISGHIGGRDVGLRVGGAAGDAARLLVLKSSVENFSFSHWDFAQNQMSTDTTQNLYLASRGDTLALASVNIAGSGYLAADGIVTALGNIDTGIELYFNSDQLISADSATWNADVLTLVTNQDLSFGNAAINDRLQLSAGANLTLFGDIAANQMSVLANAGELSLLETADVQITNGVLFNSASASADANSQISAETLQLITAGDAQWGQLTANSSLAAQAGGALVLAGATQVNAGDMNLQAGNQLDLLAGLSASGVVQTNAADTWFMAGASAAQLQINSTGKVLLDAGQVLQANLINVDANAIEFSAGSLLQANQLDAATQGDLLLGGVNITGDATLNAGGYLWVQDNFIANALTFTAGNYARFDGAFALADQLTGSANSHIHFAGLVDAGAVQLSSNSDVVFANSLMLAGNSSVDAANIGLADTLATGNLDLTATGDINLNGVTDVSGLLALVAGNDIYAQAIRTGEITADAGNISLQSLLQANQANLVASQSIAMTDADIVGAMSAQATGDFTAVALNADSLVLNADAIVLTGNLTGRQAQLNATGSIDLLDVVSSETFIAMAGTDFSAEAIDATSVTISADNIAVNGALTADDADLGASTQISLTDVQLVNSLLALAGGTFSADDVAAQAVSIDARDIVLSGLLNAQNASLTATDSIAVNNIAVGNSFAAMAAGDFSAGTLTAQSVVIDAASVQLTGALTADEVDLQAAQSIALTDSSVTGTMTANAGAQFSAQAIDAHDLTVNADDILLSGSLVAQNAGLTANQAITLADVLVADRFNVSAGTAFNAARVEAGTAEIAADTIVIATDLVADDASLTATDSIAVDNIAVGNSFAAMAAGDFSADTLTAQSVVIDAASVQLTGALTADEVDLQAAQSIALSDSSVTGTMTANAGAQFSAQAIDAHDLTVNADDILLSGSLVAQNAGLTANQAITLVDVLVADTFNASAGTAFNAARVEAGTAEIAADTIVIAADLVADDATLTATDAISLANTRVAGGLSATAGTTISSQQVMAGDLQFDAATLQLNDQVTAATAVLNATDELLINAGGISTSGDQQLSAGRVWMAEATELTSGGNLWVTANQSDLVLGKLYATTNASVISLNAIGSLWAQADIDAYDFYSQSGDWSRFDGAVRVLNRASVQSGTDLTFNNTLYVMQQLQLVSQGNMAFYAPVQADDLHADSAGDLYIGGEVTAARQSLNAAGELIIAAGLNGADELNLAADSITLSDTDLVADALSVTTQSITASPNSLVQGNSVSLDIGQDAQLGQLVAHSRLDAKVGGELRLTNRVDAGVAQIEAGSLAMQATASIDAENLALITEGDQRISQIRVSGESLELVAGGKVIADTFNAGIAHLAMSNSNGVANITAVGTVGIEGGQPLLVDLPEMNLVSEQAVDIHSLNNIRVGKLSAEQILMQGDANIHIDQLAGEAYVFANEDLTIDQANMPRGDLRANGLLQVEELNLLTHGPLGLRGDVIDVALVGDELSFADITVQGASGAVSQLDLSIDGVVQAQVHDLVVDTGSIHTSGEALVLENVTVNQKLAFSNADVLAKVDNQSFKADKSYDAQLASYKSQPLWVELVDNSLETSALAMRRDPRAVDVRSYPGADQQDRDSVAIAPPLEDQVGGETQKAIQIDSLTPQGWHAQLQRLLSWMHSQVTQGAHVSTEREDEVVEQLHTPVEISATTEGDNEGVI